MKIIVNEKVYVQVRDILFLARLYKSEILMNYYLSFINQGFLDYDFIKSKNSLLNKILATDIIIDYRDYADYTDYHLSSLIINLSSTHNGNKDIVEHKMDDLRDIISIVRKDANYTIPLIPDDKIVKRYDDLNLCFKSTIIPNYYLLEPINGEEPTHYQEAVDRGIASLKKQGIIKEEQPSYQLISKETYYVVCFIKEKKKTPRLMDKIITKLTKKPNKNLTS